MYWADREFIGLFQCCMVKYRFKVTMNEKVFYVLIIYCNSWSNVRRFDKQDLIKVQGLTV